MRGRPGRRPLVTVSGEGCRGMGTAAQTDPKRKENFFELEQRWLFLARSSEFAERLTDFSDEAKRIEDELSEV